MIDRIAERAEGLYVDTTNGDLWEKNSRGWRWVNGAGWTFVPKTLELVGLSFEQTLKNKKSHTGGSHE